MPSTFPTIRARRLTSRRARLAIIAGLGGGTAWAHGRLWRPPTPPVGAEAPPLPLVGLERLPVVGALVRYANVIGRPVDLVRRCRARTGPVFTVRIPGIFDLTYLCDEQGYELVTRSSTDDLTFGPVLANVPVVGIGFPRAGDDVSSLQDLLLVSKRLMAERMAAASQAGAPRRVAEAIGALPTGEHDLNATLVPLLLAESCRAIGGADLWERYGDRLAAPYLDVVRGIDIPRATLSVLPTRRATREDRGRRRIHAVITEMVAAHDAGEPVALVEAVRRLELRGRLIDERDVGWVIMYVLWNAATYPSTYGFWSVLDVLERPGLAADLRDLPAHEAAALAQRCVQETIRVHPLSSLPRYVTRDLVWEHGGRRWSIPAGSRVAAFPFEQFQAGGGYDPVRSQAATLPLFGQGAYRCVAARFSLDLLASAVVAAAHGFGQVVESGGRGPQRRCRVHLVHPGRPALVRTLSLPVDGVAASADRCQRPPERCPGEVLLLGAAGQP